MEILDKLRPYIQDDKPVPSALRLELAEETSKRLQTLLEKRRQALWPKDKELTELDRKVRMDADCAEYEKEYELLLRVERLLEQDLGGIVRGSLREGGRSQ